MLVVNYVFLTASLLVLRNCSVEDKRFFGEERREQCAEHCSMSVLSWCLFKGTSIKSFDLCACTCSEQNKKNTEGNDESFAKCLTQCCALQGRARRGVKNDPMAAL